MPTYDYKCQACTHQFEAFQSITAAPLKKCPKCSKAKLRRLIGTGAALLFKGDGFYITDYRSEKYKEAAKADSGAGDTSKPTAEAKSAEAPTPAKDATSNPKNSGSTAKADAKPTKKPRKV